jgi:hypothetical protein
MGECAIVYHSFSSFRMLAPLPSLPHSLDNHISTTAEQNPVTDRSKAIQENLTVFLEKMEYTLDSEPVTIDKSLEDAILEDIFSRSIPVDEKASELVRISALFTLVSILPVVGFHEFSSWISSAVRAQASSLGYPSTDRKCLRCTCL